MDESAGRKRLIWAFVVAGVVSVAMALIQPWGRFALYPFALLSTWAHEMGHGLTALLTGASFRHLELYANLGGVAFHTASGFFARPLVSMGGLLGPAVAGGAVIMLGARSVRSARFTLVGITLLLGLSLALWIRPFFGFGFLAVALVAGGLTVAARWGGEFVGIVLTQLLGIQLCLGSLSDFDYMFTKSFQRGGQVMYSDTQHIAENWLLPYWVWGALIAGTSVLILLFAFDRAWLRPARAAAADGP